MYGLYAFNSGLIRILISVVVKLWVLPLFLGISYVFSNMFHADTLSCAYRTKALVLELLAAVCLVRGGHEIILSAFDNFKEVLN